MVPSLKPPKEKEHTENSSVKPNSYYYVVFPFCSYIIYFLCFLFFSFKGSSANAEAPRDQREVAKEALSLKNHERFFSSIWIFPLLFTLIVVFLSFIFKRQEFKNLANFSCTVWPISVWRLVIFALRKRDGPALRVNGYSHHQKHAITTNG
jgi:magnesium-transporting ATPase (P-type)